VAQSAKPWFALEESVRRDSTTKAGVSNPEIKPPPAIRPNPGQLSATLGYGAEKNRCREILTPPALSMGEP